MSGSSESISILYHEMPDTWLAEARTSREKENEEMNQFLETLPELRKEINRLNELPTEPALTRLKDELNAIIRSPFIRPRSAAALNRDIICALLDIDIYRHNSRSKKSKRTRPAEVSEDVEQLKEIDTQNVSEERAMTLLKYLKADPKKALHTDDCRKLLSEDGKILNPELARRAMKVLDDLYPTIIYEKVDGSFRVRINE
ncbi:hypothetical protein M0R72_18780 [Candidatus Pacearchaeota archaeon]|jgi:hypothetical protein|nr:hypothetical protein [Candidatus Pacearchaeota archaeon]